MANLDHTSNSTSQEVPEFFKPFIRRYSAMTLEIPRAFQRQFNEMVPAKVILKEKSAGRSWHVKLEKLEKGLHFTDGWENFVNGLLSCGEFLVFKYLGNYLFHVKIFSKCGCKKQKLEIINGAVPHVKTEGEYEEQNAHRNVSPISKLENMDHYKGGKLDYNRKVHNIRPEILEHVKTEKDDEEEQIHDLNKVFQSKGTSDGRNDHSLIESSEESQDERNEVDKIHNTKRSVGSKGPRFVVTIRKGYKYRLHLPRLKLSKFDVKLKKSVALHGPNGKVDPVKVYAVDSGQVFLGTGWKKFTKINKIRLDDRCVFKCVLNMKNECEEIHVKILTRKLKLNSKA